MYIVTVEFDIHPKQLGAFLPLMLENARASRREPACLQFDLSQSEDIPTQFFLYEVYQDRAGFDAHLASAHFKAFDAATRSLVASRRIKTHTQIAF